MLESGLRGDSGGRMKGNDQGFGDGKTEVGAVLDVVTVMICGLLIKA